MTIKNTIADRDLEALRAALAGQVFVAGQAGYDQARQAWNLAVDQRPLRGRRGRVGQPDEYAPRGPEPARVPVSTVPARDGGRQAPRALPRLRHRNRPFPNADPGTRDATAQPVIRIGDDDQHRSRAIGEVMEMTRTTVKITAAAVCATLVRMLFVGSNVGAPHQPVPHPLPVGVAGPAVAARVRS